MRQNSTRAERNRERQWRFVSIAFAIVIVPLSLVDPAKSDSWPQWGGPQRNFQVDDGGLAESWPPAGPRVIWRRPLGDGYSGVVAAGGVLHTLLRRDGQEVLVAVDASTGQTLWSKSWEAPLADFMDTEFGPGPHSTPLIMGDLVVAIGVTGRLVAVERASGRLVWDRQLWTGLRGTSLERGYAASPVGFRDLVIVPVGGHGQSVIALRQKDGAIAWQAGDDDIAYASPILAEVNGQTQLIALLKQEIGGFDPGTGRRLWRLPVGDERFVNVATPIHFSENLLFFDSSAGARVLRLDKKDASTRVQELWQGKVIGSQVGNVIRVDGHLYGTLGRSAASFIAAVDLSTGQTAWRSREIGDCALLKAGNRVLALESDGTLKSIGLSPQGLTVISEARIFNGRSWTPPTLVGTALYLRDRRELVALDLGVRPK